MKLIVCLALLWTVCSSAAALQCERCSDTTCSNVTTVTCSSETMCVRATIRARNVSVSTTLFYKDCAPSSLCQSPGNQTFDVNAGHTSAVTSAECCNTDNCNTGALPVPVENTTENSLSCSFCPISSVCDTEIMCRGLEDRCFGATVISGGSNPTVGGCISSNLVRASSSLQRFPQLLNVGVIRGSLTSCSNSSCIDLTALSATTAPPNTTSPGSSNTTMAATQLSNITATGSSNATTASSRLSTTTMPGGATTSTAVGLSVLTEQGYINLGVMNLAFGMVTLFLC